MGKSMDGLASYFRPLAQQLLDEATAEGLDPVIEDTDRDEATQVQNVKNGVSWTMHSKHLPQPPENKSEAIDIVPRECMALKYWGWNGRIENSHPAWGKLIAIGQKLGLKCGAFFVKIVDGKEYPHPDPGHFEYVHKPTQIQTDAELSTT